MILAEISFGTLLFAMVASAIAGFVIAALVFKKNPKIQADVNAAVATTQAAAQQADTAAKKL